MISYFKHIRSIDRNPSLDLCRALAILPVVIFHFMMNYPNAPFQFLYNQGSLGVDLFFLLSGYLVGRVPIKHFIKHEKQNFKIFYLKRFFKIIPSFFFFLFCAYLLYNVLFPFPLKAFQDGEMLYYLTFTQNYSGNTTLYHVWSLCVEEHFYLLLPFSLFVIYPLVKGKSLGLKWFLVFVIISAYAFRYLGYSIGFETYAATHNRIDALALGVLLALLDLEKSNFINFNQNFSSRNKRILFSGIVFLLISLVIGGISIHTHTTDHVLFQVFYHGLFPLACFLILSQLLHFQFRLPFWIKLMSYFSYNWYLWHYALVFYCIYYFENYTLSFFPYLITTFAISILATYLVEEPFIRLRNKLLKRIN